MYSKVPIGTSNPGCIVILIDQSYSMSESFSDGGTKAERATQAVNNVIESIVIACRAGETIRDRCHISVIGYGDRVHCLVDGMVSEIASSLIGVKQVKKLIPDGAGGVIETPVETPIWIEPEADNGTPMHTAFEQAAEIVENWISDKPDGFPPVVINITDGEASHPDLTADNARSIMNLQTTDGAALVFNIHISNKRRGVVFPSDKTQFAGDLYAEFLFDISSSLPQLLVASAQNAGFTPEPEARCFGYDADETLMIQLLKFGTLDVTKVRALPPPTD